MRVALDDVDGRAVTAGVLAQTGYLGALYVVPLSETGVASLALTLATGLVGGVVAGDRAGGPPPRSAFHGLSSGLGGGTAFAAGFWTVLATPGAPRGAFHALARLVARHPPPGTRTHPDLVVALLAVLGGLTIAFVAAVAGWLAPSRPDSVVVEA